MHNAVILYPIEDDYDKRCLHPKDTHELLTLLSSFIYLSGPSRICIIIVTHCYYHISTIALDSNKEILIIAHLTMKKTLNCTCGTFGSSRLMKVINTEYS